jgi:tetratricopeptide (TPR) repeat protein
VSRAEAQSAEAFEAYSNQDYQTAVELYTKALEAAPSADILYNIARIYDLKLEQPEQAIAFYQRYVAASDSDPKRVQIANERLGRLRPVEAPVDSPAASRAPAQARAAPAELPAPPRSASASADRGASTLQVIGIVGGAIGLVGVGFGVGFGVDAKSSADRAHNACDGNNCRTQQGVDAAHDASRAALVSTVSLIAAGGLAAIAVTLLLVGGSSHDHDNEHAQATRLQVSPYAGPGAIGTVAAGRF